MSEDQLVVEHYFPTQIYSVEKPEYLESAREAAQEYVQKAQEEHPNTDELYPICQTQSFHDDPRVIDLSQYILNTAWNILNSQGYDMTNLRTFFSEFWCQDHAKHSAMEQHAHGYGAQIVGFYFLDCPPNSSKALFYDPRSGKTQIDLPETDMSNATPASKIINFQPKPGMLLLTNAWLPHAFTRCGSDDHMRFIHFTIVPQYVAPQTACNMPDAEVI